MLTTQYPEPVNADGLSYAPDSEERRLLEAALAEMESTVAQVPSIINGERLYTGHKSQQVNPWNPHGAPLAEYHQVDSSTVQTRAIPGVLDARKRWANMSFKHRAAVYKRAAHLVESPKYRWKLMAATMIGQGKTCGQAEGDCITEVLDTLNFHVYFCAQLYQQQPPKQFNSSTSHLDYRPLEGFLLAISPFNFTALGAHIAFTPALLGNVVLWKPSPMAVLSNYILYQIMEEAGLPSGVIQFLPVADPTHVVEPALSSRDFAGLHYTGSSTVLRTLAAQIGAGTPSYRTFPRIVGESGGKNFHLVHRSCRDDVDWIASAAVRSAFEFQGQKCSALSRLFVPRSMWEAPGDGGSSSDLRRALIREAEKMTHGEDVKQLHHALGPLVSQASFDRFREFVRRAQLDGHRLVYGGLVADDGAKGFFVQPAIFETSSDPAEKERVLESELMNRELFGPLFAVYIYEDGTAMGFEDVCDLIDRTTEYGLAGSVFARDREAVRIADEKLRDSVGNFCINDKSTGAVIGAHPFGGARSSGTNDKANSTNVLLRFSSIRCVKDSFLTATVGTDTSKRRVQDALSPHAAKVQVLTQEDNARAVHQADVVLIAVKPFKRAGVFAAPGFKDALRGKLLLSIMAGITTTELSRLAHHSEAATEQSTFQAVRAMPNMAAKIREAVTLYAATDGITRENLEFASWVYGQVGEAHCIPEGSFDICAVLVGCAGSLLLLAIDGLLDAAVAEGVRRPEVQDLVVNSAIGMMRLVPVGGEHPSVLREKIASPGGCSIRALLELERLGVRSAFTTAIMAAAEKSKKMSSS
ncbi:ALDH-like protein [Aspergillus candidus]|uniref:L-glutamate gamma-semialdehyde dehydrogenase n=1 Tax=Aspergillus candidus TaxID=41067 RepID=A0A2I2FPW3_ASPCN|nr:ALDH-like protein [Aspergillus candidus]PLB42664.1 ALDH-like protein [Aspergillus candidus]